MNTCGIDNGNTGALVLLSPSSRVLGAVTMPVLDVGKGRTKAGKKRHKWVLDKALMLATLEVWSQRGPMFVVLEKAQAMPRQGVSSTFKTGRDFGSAEMALLALELRHAVVHPRTWQTAVCKGIEGGDTKARAVIACQRLVPGLDLYPGRKRRPHDGLADAACMAVYGQRFVGEMMGAVAPKEGE
ncbi:MAG: hypothetical protein GY926_00385 [bacterium]|nr:hypothetical protein [bacterium]